MQGGFIGGFKENLKALKQEIKGADIFDSPVKFSKSAIYNKEFIIGSSIYTKEFFIKTNVYEKEIAIKTEIHTLEDSSFNEEIKSLILGLKTEVKNYEFLKPTVTVEAKALEKFLIVTKAKPIELTKKIKIHNEQVYKFKIKTFEGTDKIRKIPAIIEGRRFVSNKELIELATKVKIERPDLNFIKYNFKAVFENLPIDLIEDYQYLGDSVQIKVYYRKYTTEKSERKNLVILVEKNSLTTEKIFV